jgi:hypothetical protein
MKLIKTNTYNFTGTIHITSPSSWTFNTGNLEGDFQEIEEVYEDEDWNQTIVTSLLRNDVLLAQHTAKKPW